MKTKALLSTLCLWLLGALYITLAHNDLFGHGRTEFFSVALNSFFIISTALLVWACRKEIRKKRIRYLAGMTLWTGLAIFVGLPSQLLAFGGTPTDQTISELAKKKGISEDNAIKILYGPAVSAATEYQREVYRWNTYFELLITRNQKTEPGEVVNASSVAGLSENHLHD